MNEITYKSRFAKEEEAAIKLLADLRANIMDGRILSALMHALLGEFLKESISEVTDMDEETMWSILDDEVAAVDDNFERALRTALVMATADASLMKQKA